MNKEKQTKTVPASESTWREVLIQQGIFHAVFNDRSLAIARGIQPELLDICQKRLDRARAAHAIALREEDHSYCARCLELGICADDEKEGDDKIFEIFQQQTDSDSQFYKFYLCGKCMALDDRKIAVANGER